jgi:hypothetical protein
MSHAGPTPRRSRRVRLSRHLESLFCFKKFAPANHLRDGLRIFVHTFPQIVATYHFSLTHFLSRVTRPYLPNLMPRIDSPFHRTRDLSPRPVEDGFGQPSSAFTSQLCPHSWPAELSTTDRGLYLPLFDLLVLVDASTLVGFEAKLH